MANELSSLYKDIILDHATDPRGTDVIDRVDASKHLYNSSCGDDVVVSVAFDQDKLEAIQCVTQGCSICMASGSLMVESLRDTDKKKAMKLIENVRRLLTKSKVKANLGDSDILALQGVSQFPNRVKCAMLPWLALEDILKK